MAKKCCNQIFRQVQTYRKYILQKKWAKNLIPALSEVRSNLHPLIWRHHRQLDNRHKYPMNNNKDYLVGQLTTLNTSSRLFHDLEFEIKWSFGSPQNTIEDVSFTCWLALAAILNALLCCAARTMLLLDLKSRSNKPQKWVTAGKVEEFYKVWFGSYLQ